MARVAPHELPERSLLATHRGPQCHRDAFCAEVPRTVSLSEYITAFYASMSFTPERKLLSLIGRGASQGDIAALAEGRVQNFAAWDVEARTDDQLLMRDFQDRTCSWPMVEPISGGTGLWFGSGVRRPDRAPVKLLMPFHRWYSRALLRAAVRRLS